MRKTVAKRIRITKTGKIMRRKMGVDHFRVRKSKGQKRGQKHSLAVHSSDRRIFMQQMHRIG
jgi:ribosomal protein L35